MWDEYKFNAVKSVIGKDGGRADGHNSGALPNPGNVFFTKLLLKPCAE